MIFIEHRCNDPEKLKTIPRGHGVEMDLRSDWSSVGNLVVAHDPYEDSPSFDEWLDAFVDSNITGPLYINVKEDGLESHAMTMLNSKNIKNYFFLDSTVPTLVKYSSSLHAGRFIARLSAYESLEGLLLLKGKINWLWADCFHGVPLSEQVLKNASENFKICLVSPELQGFELAKKIASFEPLLPYVSAICTKEPSTWKSKIN